MRNWFGSFFAGVKTGLNGLPIRDDTACLRLDNFVLKNEARSPHLRNFREHMQHLARMGRRAIVALRSYDYKAVPMEGVVAKQFLPVMQAGNFKVSEVDRIVHVTQGIQVTKPDFDVGRELERRHLGMV